MMRRSIAFVACCAVIAASEVATAQTANCPARPMWPTRGWMSRTDEIATMRATEIAELERFAFTLTGADEERLGARTDAVIIIHQGAIFYERYARGFTAEMPHYTWSVTKTIANALTGIAVRRGALSITDSICAHLGMSLPRQDNCSITVQNLLEFGSGLAWTESYENQSNQASSVLAMLYGEGHEDVVSFIIGHDARALPNTTYMYSSGDATLLSGVFDYAMRRSEDENYPWTELFTPLGMDSAVLERDTRGVPIGSSFFHATPRDLAKFGFFLLNDGCWNGDRILPENWVRDSTTPSEVFRTGALLDTSPGDVQGRQIWLNRPVPEQHVTTPWPDVPEDAFAARGHWGQSITVVPSMDTVIVRVADDRDPPEGFFNGFVSRALAVVR